MSTIIAFAIDDITIEKGIPMASDKYGRKAAVLRSLEVGDSFLVPKNENVNTWRTRFHREFPKKFSSRKTADGFRIWRVK